MEKSTGHISCGACRSCRRLFTLIELLVVIAIIVILAAILLPALQKARQRGMSANCQSHQKQMGIALLSYGDSFDGWWPTGHGGKYFWYGLRAWFPNYPIDTGGTPSVSEKIPGTKINGGREQQMLNAPLFYCPQRTSNFRASKVITEIYYVPPGWGDLFTPHFQKFTRVFSPGRKFMLLETFNPGTGGGRASLFPRHASGAFVHAKKGNVLHFDGHVESYPLSIPYFQPETSTTDHAKFHYHWKPTCRTTLPHGKCNAKGKCNG